MRLRILGCAAVLAASLAVVTQAGAGQRPMAAPHTTAPDLYVNVSVKMTDQEFIVSRHSGPRGADARFTIHNISNETHNFSVGNEKFDTGVQTGFSVTVKPGQKKILILFLDIRSTIPYYPGLKADKNKPGMRGVFHIGPCTAYEQNTGVGEC
jgi:hypothetical protein